MHRRDRYDDNDSLNDTQWILREGENLHLVEVSHKDESYFESRNEALGSAKDPIEHLRAMVQALVKNEACSPKEAKLNRQSCVGFEVNTNIYGNNRQEQFDTIWFDEKTKLPVRIEMHGYRQADDQNWKSVVVHDMFEYNIQNPTGLFKPVIPENYAKASPDKPNDELMSIGLTSDDPQNDQNERERISPSSAIKTVKDSAQPLPPGKLYFNIVAAQSGETIKNIHLRAMNNERFAHHHGSGSGDIYLTDGKYECTIQAKGFEVCTLPEVIIQSQKDTDLGVIRMQQGSAVIEVDIRGHNLDPTSTAIIELYGDGRRPCPKCGADAKSSGAPSKMMKSIGYAGAASKKLNSLGYSSGSTTCSCGYSVDKTVLKTKCGGNVRFTNLAGGTYYLKAQYARTIFFDVQKVTVNPQGYSHATVTVVKETPVTFLLICDKGEPFIPEAPISLVSEEVIDKFTQFPDQEIEFVFSMKEQHIARAYAEVDLGFEYEIVTDAEISEDEIFFEHGESTPEGIDQPRKMNDLLKPPFPKPDFGWRNVKVKGDGKNLWTLSPLPAALIEMKVNFQMFKSGKIALDLRDWSGGIITVEMKKQ